MAVTMLAISLLTFTLMFLVPADPARSVVGPQATDEAVANVRRDLGLDRPWVVQYGQYLWRLLHGDLGQSFVSRRPVLDTLLAAAWPSLQLATLCATTELLLGIPVGITTALRPGTWLDRVVVILALMGLSLPNFWLGLLLLYVFGGLLDLFPLGGYGGLRYMVLPAVAVGLPYAAWYARLLRSSLLEILGEDYIRAARSRGLPEWRVIGLHAVRNATLPLITMWGLDVAQFFGGLVLIEVIFGWPGLGSQVVQAVYQVDLPLTMGTVLFVSFVVSAVNLILDFVYPLLDPRVRYRSA
jgi:peptide/nickel transport system permease protein